MSRERDKGTKFATSLLPAFNEKRPGTERRAEEGRLDRGDLNIPAERRFIVEAKHWARHSLPLWLREAEVEAANAGVPHGIVVFKRRGFTDPRKQYCLSELGAFLDLVYPDVPE